MGEPPDDWCGGCSKDNDGGCNQIHFHPLLPKRSEKTRTKLETDGKDEEDQSELLHKIECAMIDLFAEVSDENPCEEHARCAEADATKLEAAKRHAGDTDEREHADGMCDRLRFMEVEEPAHPPAIGAAAFTSAFAPAA